ncbi:MAG TPA: hypothetical protein VFN90_06740 [Gemmatimonadales bacterium]|nr:hypothetical protein [Gemmatimonadales bacterium]
MFGDAMFEEEERQRRLERGDRPVPRDEADDADEELPIAMGGLDERLRRRAAIADLLREVGGY